MTDIGVPDLPGAERECYILKPHYVPNSKVYAPIKENPVQMRYLISAQEAQELVDTLPNLDVFVPSGEKQEMHNTFRNAVKEADCLTLAKLLKTLHIKKFQILEQRKMLPSMEKEYFDVAERMLFGEIAISLGIPLEQVKEIIVEQLNAALPQPTV